MYSIAIEAVLLPGDYRIDGRTVIVAVTAGTARLAMPLQGTAAAEPLSSSAVASMNHPAELAKEFTMGRRILPCRGLVCSGLWDEVIFGRSGSEATGKLLRLPSDTLERAVPQADGRWQVADAMAGAAKRQLKTE